MDVRELWHSVEPDRCGWPQRLRMLRALVLLAKKLLRRPQPRLAPQRMQHTGRAAPSPHQSQDVVVRMIAASRSGLQQADIFRSTDRYSVESMGRLPIRTPGTPVRLLVLPADP